MNSYPYFVKQLKQGHISYDENGLDEKEAKKAYSLIWKHCLNAVCFDAGNSKRIEKLIYNGERDKYIQLVINNNPYPVTWLEFNGLSSDENAKGSVLAITDKDSCWLFAFKKSASTNNKWALLQGINYGYNQVISGLNILTLEKKFINKTIYEILSKYLGALLAMKCVNVGTIEEKPTQLQKIRAKKQGLPTFSTWTLTIKTEHNQRDYQGGTHSSPRLHLRRGHIREYKPGCFVWVSSCVVGTAELGVVAKDYRIAESR